MPSSSNNRSPLALMQQRLVYKITGLSVLLVVVTIAYFSIVTWVRERDAIQAQFGLALERIVATAALQIDGDAHRAIREPGDAESANFRQIRDVLRGVRAANDLEPSHLYTFQPGEGPTLKFAVMLQDRSFVGDPYTIVPENRDAYRRAVSFRVATRTAIYADEHGRWVSAYAPILDRAGDVAGVLEADYDVGAVYTEMTERVQMLVLTSLSAVALALVLSVLLGRGIGRALQHIREAAEAIAREDYGHRIDVDRDDELGMVAGQLNQMAETLAERFHLLKFIPRHTLDAVERRIQGHALQTSERTAGTVVFTDIRGYTALSAELEPERVVEMLNEYLRVQAEVFARHDGVVDKFIGDAVLALFLGEGAPARAVAASLEIQDEVARLNAAGAFSVPVHVGIGVACGPLVLGEIGSSERRERTVIGSVVNLASRLCSRAQSGEVMVSDPVLAAVGARAKVARSESATFKGFAEAQTVHVISGIGPASA